MESTKESFDSSFEEDRRSNDLPEWVNPLLKGIEDAELLGQRRKSIECSSITVKFIGSNVIKDKSPYVLYHILLNSGVSSWEIKRRYTDFVYLHQQLKKTIPENKIPQLPPKKFIGSQLDPVFIEQRGKALQEYVENLIRIDSVWLRSDLVRFLDNENNTLTFLWNVERMRKMQELLNTLSMDSKTETEKLSTELGSAKDQINELQNKIAQMEMFFLQHATGVANTPLAESTLRSISGTSASIDFNLAGEDSRYRFRANSEMDPNSIEVSKLERESIEVDRALEAAINSHRNSKTRISTDQLREVLSLTSDKRLSRDYLKSEDIRKKSSDQITSLALSLQLQEAVRLSEQLFDTSTPSKSSNRPKNVGKSPEKTDSQDYLSLIKCSECCFSEVDSLISALGPRKSVSELRESILNYVKGISLVTLRAMTFSSGVYIRDTFSPKGDIEVTLCLSNAQFDRWYVSINEALCTSALSGAYVEQGSHKINVDNVSFINSELKIIKTIINNVSVDISANHIRSLYEQSLIQKIDSFIDPTNHLFKKSLHLLKVWCFFESPRYSAGSTNIFSNALGKISSWSMTVLMIHIFNIYGDDIKNPLQALILLFDYFSSFDWSEKAVTALGIVSTSDIAVDIPTKSKDYIPKELIEAYTSRMSELMHSAFKHIDSINQANKKEENLDSANQVTEANQEDPNLNTKDEKLNKNHPTIIFLSKYPKDFKKGFMNIIDPFEPTMNLCEAVDSFEFSALQSALSGGAEAFEICNENSQPDCIKSLFQFSFSYINDSGNENLNDPVDPSFWDSSYDELESSIEIMELILASIPSLGAISRLVYYILEQKGPIPVGEIGKQLLEFTGSDLLVKNIKNKFGGLKKSIELNVDLFSLGTDHPFNPLVSLNQSKEALHKFPISPNFLQNSGFNGNDTFLPISKSNSFKETKETTGTGHNKGPNSPGKNLNRSGNSQKFYRHNTEAIPRMSGNPFYSYSSIYSYPQQDPSSMINGNLQNLYPPPHYVPHTYPLYGFQHQHPSIAHFQHGPQGMQGYPMSYPVVYPIDPQINLMPPPVPAQYQAQSTQSTTDNENTSENSNSCRSENNEQLDS